MRRFVFLVASVAALGGLLFGYDTGVISGAILFIKTSFHLNYGQQGIAVSIVLIGAMAGALAAGPLADRFGRRPTLIAAGVVFGFGALLSAFATLFEVLLAGRLIVGFAIGLSSVVAPLYISEVAPADSRGALVSLYQFAITVGILAAFLIDYAFAGSGAWRLMLGIATIPSAVLALGMLPMPESPRQLVRAGRDTEALQLLARIFGDQAQHEEDSIRATLAGEKTGIAALQMPQAHRALWIGIALAVLQQITGINTVIYYGPQIFQMAGTGGAQASILATAIVGIVNVLLTVVAICFVDRIGRRRLLYAGCAGMAIALFALAYAFAHRASGGTLSAVALGSLMLYVGCFAFSLGPIVWLLIAEIFPLPARGLGMSICTLANWAANFLVSLFFLNMIDALGETATFATYGALAIVTLLFVWRFVPETKRVLLETIRV